MLAIEEEIGLFGEILKAQTHNVVVTAHKDPDGDALGASLAVGHWLRKYGHTVDVVFPSAYADSFHWLPGLDKTLVSDFDMEAIVEKFSYVSLIIYLDFNGLGRIESLSELCDSSNAKKVMIDHHRDPEPIADVIISDIDASSTCELVYQTMTSIYGVSDIDKDIATCLYTGIITDTGSFRFNVRPRLFLYVSQLLETGIRSNVIQDLIFNNLDEKYLHLLGTLLTERMIIMPEWNTGIFYLTKKDYQRFDIQRGDTEGIINYLLKVKSIKLAVFFRQQQNIIKVSLRSKGRISVQEIARDLFNGGGHLNASGGYLHSSLRKAITMFQERLPQYLSKYKEFNNE